MRESVSPGARHLNVVTRKLTAPTVVEIPTNTTPIAQKSIPLPGEYSESVSGAYANQPPSGAVPNAHHEREDPRDHEERERREEVADADALVVHRAEEAGDPGVVFPPLAQLVLVGGGRSGPREQRRHRSPSR